MILALLLVEHIPGIICSVLIWDDTKKDIDKKIVLEFTFSQPVVNVRLRKDMYVTVCELAFAFQMLPIRCRL